MFETVGILDIRIDMVSPGTVTKFCLGPGRLNVLVKP